MLWCVTAGVQLAKLSPFRVCVIMLAVAIASISGRVLGFEVLHVYTSVSGFATSTSK